MVGELACFTNGCQVGTPEDADDKDTFKGSWCAWTKHQLKIYWQENFSDFSIKHNEQSANVSTLCGCLLRMRLTDCEEAWLFGLGRESIVVGFLVRH